MVRVAMMGDIDLTDQECSEAAITLSIYDRSAGLVLQP